MTDHVHETLITPFDDADDSQGYIVRIDGRLIATINVEDNTHLVLVCGDKDDGPSLAFGLPIVYWRAIARAIIHALEPTDGALRRAIDNES